MEEGAAMATGVGHKAVDSLFVSTLTCRHVPFGLTASSTTHDTAQVLLDIKARMALYSRLRLHLRIESVAQRRHWAVCLAGMTLFPAPYHLVLVGCSVTSGSAAEA